MLIRKQGNSILYVAGSRFEDKRPAAGVNQDLIGINLDSRVMMSASEKVAKQCPIRPR